MIPAQVDPDLGVIVVTYRSGRHLDGCFAGLRSVAAPGAVVVVDSASPDDTLEVAAALWPETTRLRMDDNLGYAAGVNAGLRLLSQPFVLVLNPDTRVDSSGLRAGLEWLRRHTEFGMLGPRLLGADGRPQASRLHEPTIPWAFRTYLARDAREAPPLAHVDGALEARVLAGAALLVRRDACRAVGGMDEGFWLFSEEVDWCVRFRRAGYRLASLPGWTLTHLGGASTALLPVHHQAMVHRSRHRYFLKHHGRAAAGVFRLLLGLSLPWAAVIAAVNALLGRITWREAWRRVHAQAAALLSPGVSRPASRA
ncbi:MAG: glycosyltransferase family 2 protein [Candidatus Eisenbacteria bacterium]|nr:glycosyltransferase family 2 protein [Candidatus Eisenbacteria bacterium]